MLQETLASIMSQHQEGIEVVVSDNHSQDGTYEKMVELQSIYPSIVYYRWEQEVPCGDNLLQAVKLARGTYCWLMTDDDRVEQGGVRHVLELLERYPDLTGLSVNVEGYDKRLQEKKTIRYTHHLKGIHHFKEGEAIFTSLGAWMGFWSAHIVRREYWQQAEQRGRHLFFTGYHHLAIMVEMARLYPSWLFTDQKCVGYRADNESFHQEYGRIKRFEIDALAYTTVGQHLFSKKAIKAVNKQVICHLLFWQLVTMKCEQHSRELFKELFNICYRYYHGYLTCWLVLIPTLLIPSSWMIQLRGGYRKWKQLKQYR